MDGSSSNCCIKAFDGSDDDDDIDIDGSDDDDIDGSVDDICFELSNYKSVPLNYLVSFF